ncbi:GGDEF domain-containing protein [Pseudomonas sp. LTJR-52]|nr:GGDEF domain-containing protein [Pseudomonas sp. LTJR-52]
MLMMAIPQWQENLQHIRHLRLFRDVDLSHLEKLARTLTKRVLNPGEMLLSPSEHNHYLYMIVQGRFRVHLESLDNQPVSVLSEGDCAGEVSFLDNHKPTAYVIADEVCEVIGLHRKDLFQLMEHSPKTIQNLLEILCERVRQNNRIILDTERNANVDTLTGLFNRRRLEQLYERESTRCAFNQQPLCLLMLDVDHFKRYNDTYGHLAGDYALCMVANTLRSQLRPKDSMSRYGGEEFVILLPELDKPEARMIGERLRESLASIADFYSPAGKLPGVTISIGLAEMHKQDTLETHIERADKALYEAKRNGRNCLFG